tara:strand:- start:583 stop:1845 length:1263 start_codon:yes stop_codon:yes gene_type:complete
MSTIKPQDQELIAQVKEKIEQLSGLPGPDSWTQKDYDFLGYYIDEKSGVRISLSTLKRIWRNENNRLPHNATLDALSQVAFQQTWLALKADFTPKRIVTNPKKANKYKKLGWLALTGIIMGSIVYLGYGFFKSKPTNTVINSEKIFFSARTSVENKVPNSVVFDYDLSDVRAEKFYLQQSWDARRRVEISKKNTQQTDIYYVPGLYFAKLIADTTVLATIPVHIKMDAWFVQASIKGEERIYPKNEWSTDGVLAPSLLEADKRDLNNRLSLAVYNAREFNTDGDNFSYSSTFKMDTIATVQCPKVSIIIKGENDYFLIQLIQKGCESDAYLKLSEKEISGKNTDLTMLGANLYQWKNLAVSARDRSLTLRLNESEIYKNSYAVPIGDIKEITYIFSGWGAIDNVELTNADGKITFADYFD